MGLLRTIPVSTILTLFLTQFKATIQEEGRDCAIFLAPSKFAGGGWGVFAARDFARHEIVELTPLFIPIDYDEPVMKHSVLDDYIYGYTRIVRGNELYKMANTMLGFGMFYNHHPVDPNVQSTTFGREPTPEHPMDVNIVGFTAKRAIEAGEELFTTYGDQYEDGGRTWFLERDLELRAVDRETSSLTTTELAAFQKTYCSRIMSGMGKATFETRLAPMWPDYLPTVWKDMADRLPPLDAPLGSVRTKISLNKGDRIEVAPALILDDLFVSGTALASLGFRWNHGLTEQHRETLKRLRNSWSVQFQGPSSQWKRVDHFSTYNQIVVFPAAGSIGMVERLGKDSPAANCRLEIKAAASTTSDGNAGIVIELIATKKLDAGETLYLDLPPAGTTEERAMLDHELKTTGQPLRQQHGEATATPLDEL